MSSEKWYFIWKGERQGPVEKEEILEKIRAKNLQDEDYVWTKGFETWRKIRELENLKQEALEDHSSNQDISQTSALLKLEDLETNQRNIYVRIGDDRGLPSSEYGPFYFHQLKKLYNENRINEHTFIYSKVIDSWRRLSEFSDFSKVFGVEPELSTPSSSFDEKRSTIRKPFIARLFVNNDKVFFEGICRDVSIGGMQVLIDHFAGTPGDKISINVHPENENYHFVASGVIVRLLEGNSGFSFRFQNLSPDAKKSIENYLQDYDM